MVEYLLHQKVPGCVAQDASGSRPLLPKHQQQHGRVDGGVTMEGEGSQELGFLERQGQARVRRRDWAALSSFPAGPSSGNATLLLCASANVCLANVCEYLRDYERLTDGGGGGGGVWRAGAS